jgi:hypothetical protein
MKRTITGLLLLLCVPLSVAACLWDSDTPAEEAKGLPEVVAVLTGRFDRNPPLYYKMRLARVTALLMGHSEDLGAYDDAGVACDRLGNGDEAVAWMEKKKAQLELLDASRPEVKEQRYRYHANLGTFLVHRWSRQGADRSKLDEVKAGRDEIAKALEINPDAHFGREKFQLMAMDWMINPPKSAGEHDLPNLLGWQPNPTSLDKEPKDADAAVRGLAGLIMLGNAWQSVDVFHALRVALQHDTEGFSRYWEGGRNALAFMAWLRCRDLIDAGQGSILPDATKGAALKAFLPDLYLVEASKHLGTSYVSYRADADAWHEARIAFMMERLKAGRHPDIDPDFWLGYTERPSLFEQVTPVPTSYDNTLSSSTPQTFSEWIGSWKWTTKLLFIGLSGLAFAMAANRRSRARRRKAIVFTTWDNESLMGSGS